MLRQVFIKIDGEARSSSPKTGQWAGMQYEDNATEVVFDLSALGVTDALYRIDFSSEVAGYHPGENLTPDTDGCISRAIPHYLTMYGGELTATAVITLVNSDGATDSEILSYPVSLHFTSVLRSEEGEAETYNSISAAAEEVHNMKSDVIQCTAAVNEMYNELHAANVTAAELLEVKEAAETVTEELLQMLQNGELSGVGKATAEGGEIFGDYENNRAEGRGTSASGLKTRAGAKAFKILSIVETSSSKTYDITVRGNVRAVAAPYAVGDILQITANVNFNNSFKISAIRVNGETSVLSVERADNRSVQAMSLAEEHPNNTENWLYVAGKSGWEETPWLICSAAFGEEVAVTGESAFGAGFMNTVAGDFAAAFGRGNKAGYAGLVSGALNEVGDYAFASGNGNRAVGIDSVATGVATEATKYASRAGGSGTIARNEFATAEGLGTKTGRQAQFNVGMYNKGRGTTLFEVGNGASNSERSNAFEVFDDGSVAIGGITLTPEKLTRLLALIEE